MLQRRVVCKVVRVLGLVARLRCVLSSCSEGLACGASAQGWANAPRSHILTGVRHLCFDKSEH